MAKKNRNTKQKKRKFYITDSSYGKIRSENRILLDEYLEHMKSIGRAKGTIDTYRGNITMFLIWNMRYNNNIRIINVKKNQYLKFQEYTRREFGWSDNRVHIVQRSVSSFLDYLISTEEYPGAVNYVKQIPILKPTPVKKVVVLTRNDVNTILEMLVKKEMYREACAVALIISSGRLPGDLAQFKASWFKDENIVSGSLYFTPEPIRIAHSARNVVDHVYIYKPTCEKYLKLWLDYRKEHNVTSTWLFPRMMRYGDGMRYSSKQTTALIIDKMIIDLNDLHLIQKRISARSLSNYFGDHMKYNNIPDEVINEITKWRPGKAEKHYEHHAKEFLTDKFFNDNGIKEKAKSKGRKSKKDKE